ncbi:MAG TPA: serine/threonine-protein kinase, partial [Candidatus Obscuribacterales bacterium]
ISVASEQVEGTTTIRECDRCGGRYRGEESPCPHEGMLITERPEDKLIGTVLADHYKIISLIGTGGMSAVYKARHQLIDRVVAIKVLHSHLVSQATTLKRFQQEANAVSHLSHPHIIAIHDFGISAQAQPYLIMDYLEGTSLSDVLEKEISLPLDRALPIFLQICDALDHAHKHGVVHRDMKPSNVMLLTNGPHPDFVKIVDFGIAKLMPTADTEGQHLTKTGEVFGSPLYMSPEQCMGQPLDARSDVYSMGCVMYETLVGRPPFHGNNVLETMYMRLSEPPKPFSALRPDLKIPAAIESVVMTAMASEPAERFQSMHELKQQLELARLGYDRRRALQLIIPRATGSVKRLLRKTQSRRAKIIVALSALLIVVSGALVWKMMSGTPSTAAEKQALQNELTWMQYEREGQTLLDQGNYAEAEKKLRAAVELAEQFGETDSRLSTSLEMLANLYREQNRDGEADEIGERIARIAEQHPEHEVRREASNLNQLVDLTLTLVPKVLHKEDWASYKKLTHKLSHLANLCIEQKEYARAEELLKKELEIESKTRGERTAEVALTLTNLASLYHINQGKYDKAEPLYKKALEIRIQVFGLENSMVASSLINLARLYQDQDRYRQAEENYRKALAIYWKSSGENSPDAASALAGLGGLYRREGRYGEAEPLYKKALEINETNLGENDPGMASSLTNLANLYYDEGKYAQAEPLYKRALAIFEKTKGPEDPGVAKILNNLAAVLYKQSKYGEAEPLLRRALAIRSRVLPPDHPELAQSLNSLAEVFRAEGKYDEAEPLLTQALEINAQVFGPEHPEVASILNGFGHLYAAEGKNQEAEAFYRRALAMREKVLGPDHPDTARSVADLGNLYMKEGKTSEAQPLLSRALKVRESVLGPDHPDTLSTVDSCANLYLTTGKVREGLEMKWRVWTANLKKLLPFAFVT